MLKRAVWTSAKMGKAVKKGNKEQPTAPRAEPEERAISVNKNGQIVLRIHAKPGAKISTVTNIDESEIGVAIAAPPREGQANEELLGYIGRLLGLRKSELDFDKGAKSRSKVLLITTGRLSEEQVVQKIREAAAG